MFILVSYSIRLAVSVATGWAEKKQKPRLGSGWTFVVEVSDGSGEVICVQAFTSVEANRLVRSFYGSYGCGMMVIRMETGASDRLGGRFLSRIVPSLFR
jgi:hypothetical protein